ncbi:MAG: winged helix-turn-helix transcriptional regulator [Polyangiaceae bacterium]|nr:winged helix-turn-helix transcriptional regulator [Polyangiaceae bacterium]
MTTAAHGGGRPSPKTQGVLAGMMRALGHPQRFQLFVEILAGERSFEGGDGCFLSSIIGRLKIGAPTVSHHLKELVHAELVRTARNGKFVTCSVNREALALLADFFARAEKQVESK